MFFHIAILLHIFAIRINFGKMEKKRLISIRTSKGITQQQIADKLFMDISNYNRKEKGHVKIRTDEWEKLSEILETPLEEIYEAEETHCFVFRDSSTGNYLGTNHFYSIPEHFLESQRKYIQKLEEEIESLKQQIEKKQ